MKTQHILAGESPALEEDRSALLRLFLKIDAAVSGTLGVLSLAFGSALERLLGIPAALLITLGALLVVWAVALWALASVPRIIRAAVWAVISLNLLYAMGALVLVAAGWFPLSALGVAFVLAPAAAVLLFAAAQFYALRRV